MPRKKLNTSATVIRRKRGWFARLRYENPDGTVGETSKKCKTQAEAREKARVLEAKYTNGGATLIKSEYMTFRQLGNHFNTNKAVDAVFVKGKKVAGYKHPDKLRNRVNALVNYFGDRKIASISYTDCETFKLYLITTPTKKKQQRSMEDTNNQLRTLRQLFNYAVTSKWLESSPLKDGVTLINDSDEEPRNRPEQPGELTRMLNACIHARAYCKLWIVAAIDTSGRPGEIDRLRWKDLLWDQKLIRLRVEVTKTQKERFVPLTSILEYELRSWFNFVVEDKIWSKKIGTKPDDLIFGDFKQRSTAWKSLLKDAKVQNVQRKDLRHWGTTRLVKALKQANIPEMTGMDITGHTQFKTYRGYVNKSPEDVRQAGRALQNYRPKWDSQLSSDLDTTITIREIEVADFFAAGEQILNDYPDGIIITRNGRQIAEITPITTNKDEFPYWINEVP